MDVTRELRNKLMIKKNNHNFKKLGDVVEAMYKLISKHKMWEELKNETRN